MGLLRWTGIGIACALTTAGCARKAAPPPAAPAAKKSTGRLVPAVLANFERGPGGWKSAPAATGDASLEAPVVVTGGAAKGERWLAQTITVAPGQTRTVNVYGVVPARDWSRFGDTVRAFVRAVPAGKVSARLYLGSPFAKETDGPDRDVPGQWTPLVWNAGDAVHQVSRIGVRFTVTGPWHGKLGLDNVRIGAEDALTTAYSVAYGPYESREKAVEGMNALKTSGIESFPVYEQGWYLNLGTFSTRKSAHDEAKRLTDRGLKTTILVR